MPDRKVDSHQQLRNVFRIVGPLLVAAGLGLIAFGGYRMLSSVWTHGDADTPKVTLRQEPGHSSRSRDARPSDNRPEEVEGLRRQLGRRESFDEFRRRSSREFEERREQSDREFEEYSRKLDKKSREIGKAMFGGLAIAAVGTAMTGIGIWLCVFGYGGAVAKYAADELRPGIRSVSESFRSGGRDHGHDGSAAGSGVNPTAGKYCSQCGERLPSDARFCSGCGEELSD